MPLGFIQFEPERPGRRPGRRRKPSAHAFAFVKETQQTKDNKQKLFWQNKRFHLRNTLSFIFALLVEIQRRLCKIAVLGGMFSESRICSCETFDTPAGKIQPVL